MKCNCSYCDREFPSYKLASTSFTEEACESCINLLISELEDALDTIRRKSSENDE